MQSDRKDYLNSIKKYKKRNVYSLDMDNLSEAEKERIKAALDKALDIRKFEIDLYWKRTQYFWAFLVTIYGSFFAVYATDKLEYNDKALALVGFSILGVFFSMGWHLVNRGSKFWQQNWENHVDELEDYVYGPIYKTIIAKTSGGRKILGIWMNPVGAFPFSVSNINCFLSGVVAIANFVLFFFQVFRLEGIYFSGSIFSLFLGICFFASYSRGTMADAYMENKNEQNQPVFLNRDIRKS